MLHEKFEEKNTNLLMTHVTNVDADNTPVILLKGNERNTSYFTYDYLTILHSLGWTIMILRHSLPDVCSEESEKSSANLLSKQ